MLRGYCEGRSWLASKNSWLPIGSPGPETRTSDPTSRGSSPQRSGEFDRRLCVKKAVGWEETVGTSKSKLSGDGKVLAKKKNVKQNGKETESEKSFKSVGRKRNSEAKGKIAKMTNFEVCGEDCTRGRLEFTSPSPRRGSCRRRHGRHGRLVVGDRSGFQALAQAGAWLAHVLQCLDLCAGWRWRGRVHAKARPGGRGRKSSAEEVVNDCESVRVSFTPHCGPVEYVLNVSSDQEAMPSVICSASTSLSARWEWQTTEPLLIEQC